MQQQIIMMHIPVEQLITMICGLAVGFRTVNPGNQIHSKLNSKVDTAATDEHTHKFIQQPLIFMLK